MSFIPKKTQGVIAEPLLSIIYGLPKIGKTTLIAELPENLILDFEGGSAAVDGYKVNIPKEAAKAGMWPIAYAFAVIAEVTANVVSSQKYQFNFITLDTLNALVDHATAYIIASHNAGIKNEASKISSLGDIPHGKGWGQMKDLFFSVINQAKTAVPYVIGVAHSKNVTEDNTTGIPAKTLGLTPSISSSVSGAADLIAQIKKVPSVFKGFENGDKHALMFSFDNKGDVTAGTRNPNLAGKEIIADWGHIFPSVVAPKTEQPVELTVKPVIIK